MERRFFVLVPVYNTENYIDACIRSVLTQSYPGFRLILVDDGSFDRSGEICDGYAEKDTRITVIHKENGGQNSARNAAMLYMQKEAAEADFAVFLDSDDALKPDALRILADAIDRSGADMVIYGIDRVYEGKTLYSFNAKNGFLGIPGSRRELYRTVFFSSEYNSLCRKAVSLDLVRRMAEENLEQYYHIRFGEDLLLSISLYKFSKRTVFIPDRIYAYTWNPRSVSSGPKEREAILDTTVRQKVLEALEQETEWTDADKCAYRAYCKKRVMINLLHVEKLSIPYREKRAILRQIKADPYYQKILEAATSRDIPLYLLQKDNDQMLLLYLRIYNTAVQIKQLLRKIFAR